MRKVLVIAPHPDDETLGCGGTILKHKASGDSIHWLIVTNMSAEHGYSAAKVSLRQAEIAAVTEAYGFDSVYDLRLPPAGLDQIPKRELIEQIGTVFGKIEPEVIYLPNMSDIHSDHKDVFAAAMACTKWFRCKSVRRILSYETLSETEFSTATGILNPAVFVDITGFLDRKISIMGIYGSEMSDFPFPRSIAAIEALARLRGTTAGCAAAEAFFMIKEIL